jgi:uncharacterized membrane protein
MAFCPKCGAQVENNVAFCPACGAALGAQYQASTAITEVDANDAQTNKGMAILAYIGILVLIPLLAGAWKTSPFVKFHTNQSLILWIGCIAYGIVVSILTVILAFIPIIGWLLIIILNIAYIAFGVFAILGIINAANGEQKPLPFIGEVITILK